MSLFITIPFSFPSQHICVRSTDIEHHERRKETKMMIRRTPTPHDLQARQEKMNILFDSPHSFILPPSFLYFSVLTEKKTKIFPNYKDDGRQSYSTLSLDERDDPSWIQNTLLWCIGFSLVSTFLSFPVPLPSFPTFISIHFSYKTKDTSFSTMIHW